MLQPDGDLVAASASGNQDVRDVALVRQGRSQTVGRFGIDRR